ncbi:hypothetical protein LUZ60_012036 [Juncus effusus]|nr:hypothetical protein LUZ60_012036 [Juncus effusus]
MEETSNQLIWPKKRTLCTSNAINESHSFLENNNNNNRSFPTDLASNHQNCEITTDVALKYISHVLFDKNINENINLNQEETALQAVEKSFYDILEQENPASPNNLSVLNFSDSICDANYESLPILQFKKGVEDGMKFLPIISTNNYLFDLRNKKDEDNIRFKGKKHANSGDLSNLDGPKCKISLFYFKDPAMDEIYNEVLLLHGYTKAVIRLSKVMQSRMKQTMNTGISVISGNLRTLLLHCSQALAMNDPHTTNELIKQVRKHSSPDGDGVQRMAHIFVNALEARLAGTGNELYCRPISTRENIKEILKTHNLFVISSPFVRASYFFANHTILNAIERATKLHIIHFGIDFCFQWPHLMLALSERKKKNLKLRITGITNPLPGFHPNERVEEIGRKLQEYARSFGIPFEHKGIAKKWEEICIKDLNIEKDELVIVNSLYCFENLGDGTDVMYNPRNHVLDIIRQIKPQIFIQGIINGSFSGSLFATRFKQVLLHYSAMFDMLDSTVPSDNKERHFIENKIWAYDVFNLIACEGSNMVEMPETYKQWEMRNLRAGFEQLPINHTIVKKIKKKVTKIYDKNFFIEDDKNWLLLGWRGRTICALSTWQVKEI